MLLSPDQHQIETIEYASNHSYSILALDMGLGKSYCALSLWEKLRGHCLIVCPAYLILNWKSEIEKCLGLDVVVTAIKKGSDIYDLVDTDIAIISYDLAQKAESLFGWCDMLIIDEGQELKSMKAKRTEFMHRVVFENSIPRLHILTGTPIKNRVEEYYSLIALCNYDPALKSSPFLDKFPDSVTFADYFSFRREYTIEIRGRFVSIVKWEGSRNEAELKGYLKGHYIRFTSDQVLKIELPRNKDILISEVPDKSLLAEFENYYEDEENKTTGPSKKAEAALKKVPFTVNYVKKLLEEIECVPIYTDHVESCKALAKAFGCPAITGEMAPDKRITLAHEFQAGKHRVLCATIKSFSTGVTLTRANNLVFNDYPWVPGDIKQAIYRVHRRDQTKRAIIHRVLGSPQDKYILETLESKNSTIDKVV